MSQRQSSPYLSAQEDEINLRELLGIFWRKRLLIALVAILFGGIALGFSFLVSKKYTAAALISPVAEESGGLGGAGSALSEYKGLASLAGLSLPGNEKKEEAIALLKSTVITEDFIQTNNLLPVLYASRWDAASGRWRVGVKVPTLWEASQFFAKKIRTVEEDSKTGLVTLSIKWKDPQEAADWANGLVHLTNDYARQKEISVAVRDIAFLNQQAATTPYVEEREGIFTILQTELTKEMLAKGTDEFALKVIDPAFAPEKPSFPQPMIWTLAGLFAGVVVGSGYALIRSRAAAPLEPVPASLPRAAGGA